LTLILILHHFLASDEADTKMRNLEPEESFRGWKISSSIVVKAHVWLWFTTEEQMFSTL
jgi:hypothetical protein